MDKSLTPAQREGIGAVLPAMFPMKWKSTKIAEGVIDTWRYDKNGAVALLDGGKTAEVRLKSFPGMKGEQVVIKNLPYWGAARNDGFVMMPNEVEAYRVGPERLRVQGHERLHAHPRHGVHGHGAGRRGQQVAFTKDGERHRPPFPATPAAR